MWPTIGDYYRAAIEGAKKEIEATPDERVLGMDPEEWINYLIAKWGMTPIVLDGSRVVEMDETTREYTLGAYDVYTDSPAGTVRRETAVTVKVPVEPSDTLQVIIKQKLAPNTFTISHPYPPFEYSQSAGLLTETVAAEPAAVRQTIGRIQDTVRSYNQSIENENGPFRREIQRLAATRRDRLAQKHKDLDALAETVGIRLTKKADPASIVPIAPKVKPTIAPVLPALKKKQTAPVLDAASFEAILSLVDNTGRQFERTPQAFSALTEEGLRDILLSGLNAVFAGAAGGETFQGVGKCDIHLRIAQGEVFIAELKFWTGPESLREVISQLRNRLSWRDAYGVAIILSRNARFSEVLRSVTESIAQCEGFMPGSITARAENHNVARFTITSDTSRQAILHVIVYNLHSDSPGDRIVKRNK